MKRKDGKVRVPEIKEPSASNENEALIVPETETEAKVTVTEDYSGDPEELPELPKKKKKAGFEAPKKTKNDVAPIKLELENKNANSNSNVGGIEGKKKKANSKSIPFVIGAAVIVVLIFALTLFYSGGLDERLKSPLTINGQYVDSAEFSFMYHYILIDNGVDVFAQDTREMLKSPSEDPNFATQRDYFLNLTAQQMQTTKILYDDALLHGLSIGPEHETLARAYIDWLSGKAFELGIPLDTYIKGVFGSQVDEQIVLNTLAKQYFTEDYASGAKLLELQASSEQAEEAYQTNRNAYDTVNYKILRITYEQRDQAFIDTANLHADQIIEGIGHDASLFESVASEYFSGEAKNTLAQPDSTLVADARYDDFTHLEFRDWLYDFSRTPGDATIFHDSNGFPIILCFVNRDRQSVPLRNVRFVHILTSAGEGPGFGAAEAQYYAQSIYDMISDETDIQSVENIYTDAILDGSITVTHSSDTYPSKFDGILASWIFSDERSSGDKAFLETNDGYYIVYMVSISDQPEWYDRVNSFIRMQNYQAFMAEMESEYSYEFIQLGLDAIQDVP